MFIALADALGDAVAKIDVARLAPAGPGVLCVILVFVEQRDRAQCIGQPQCIWRGVGAIKRKGLVVMQAGGVEISLSTVHVPQMPRGVRDEEWIVEVARQAKRLYVDLASAGEFVAIEVDVSQRAEGADLGAARAGMSSRIERLGNQALRFVDVVAPAGAGGAIEEIVGIGIDGGSLGGGARRALPTYSRGLRGSCQSRLGGSMPRR